MAALPPESDRRLRAVEDTLANLARRVARLEVERAGESGGRRVTNEVPEVAPVEPPGIGSLHPRPLPQPPPWWRAQTGVATLAGRVLIVLAGAFLLRAVTEAGSLTRASGMTWGFVYALFWVGVAHRVAPRNAQSAMVHGATGVLIGLPLLLEASGRYQFLTPVSAAGAVALVVGLGLAVAWHRQLPGLAIVTTLAASLVVVALAAATAVPVPFAWLALALSVATALMGTRPAWHWLQWPASGVTAMLLLAMLVRAAGPTPLASSGAMLAIAGADAATGLWIGNAPALLGRRPASSLDWWNGGGAVLLGVGGSLYLADRAVPGLSVVIALSALLLAAAGYAMSLALSADRAERRPAVALLSSQALLIVLLATPVAFSGAVQSFWLAVLSGLFSWLGARRYQPHLLAQGALFAVIAAAAGGLPGALANAWFLPVDQWPALPARLWPVAVAAAIGVFGPRLASGGAGASVTATARLVLAGVLVGVVGTWLVTTAGHTLRLAPLSPGPIAALRSVVIAVLTVALALAGSMPRGRALSRLAPVVLVLGGAKFLAEDVWRSSPILLFVALASYGLAMVIGSRVGRAR